MTDRERHTALTLTTVAISAVAIAARLGYLWWSPLPATLDGFRYVALAETTLSSGQVPVGVIDADEFVFTLGLAIVSSVTGLPSLSAAQPYVATAGAAAPLIGAALAARIVRERGWVGTRRRVVVAGTGLALALEGLFLRRTGVPDEEALGLVLVPVVALLAHWWLVRHRHRYAIAGGVVLVALPLLHNLSSLMGVLAVTALATLHAVRSTRWPTLRRSGVLVGAVWIVFVGYFEAAARLGLQLTYTGLIRPYRGLFLAWVLVLIVAVAWTRAGTPRTQRLAAGVPIGLFVLLAGVNAVLPVFPGTITTPPLVALLLAGFVPALAVAAWAAPTVRTGTGVVILATAAAPIVFVLYALSASLTPPFFSAIIRVQSFAHVPVVVLAGVGAVALVTRAGSTARGWQRWGAACAVLVLVGGVLATTPLGFMNLDTTAVPSTTIHSEFAATEFVATHTTDTVATDHSLSRVVIHYHTPLGPPIDGEVSGPVTVGATRTWLTGGPPPDCGVLSQRSWTTTGAHLYPTQPHTIERATYERTLATRNVVYSGSGRDPAVFSLPRTATPAGC